MVQRVGRWRPALAGGGPAAPSAGVRRRQCDQGAGELAPTHLHAAGVEPVVSTSVAAAIRTSKRQ